MQIPDHITYYHSARDKPFLNLSDVPEDQIGDVLRILTRRHRDEPGYRRVFGTRYMALRRATEVRLKERFLAIGGKPERSVPHYFVLGDCPWFSGLYPDTRAIKIAWETIPQNLISFTYPDSFVSMQLGADFGLHSGPPMPYHGQVFPMRALAEVIALYGLPDGREEASYAGYAERRFEKYIEVQLWSDAPIAAFVKPAG